jgi:predicted metal-dependent phosphoesterase TrpH
MLLDFHVHSSGISQCGRIPYDETIRRAKEKGLDGIILTNHYFDGYVKDGDAAAFAARYAEEFRLAHAYGKQVGLEVLFGIELSFNAMGGSHIKIYGVSPEFVLEHPALYDYSPEKLYETVHAAGGILVQAHPLRRGSVVQDLRYLDGLEMNCHPLYEGHFYEKLAPVAREHGKIVTCGSDYHGDTFRPRCGVFVPDGTDTAEKLRDYLVSAEKITLLLSEGEFDQHEEIFERNA